MRRLSILLATVLMATGLTAVTHPAAADPPPAALTLDKQAPAAALLGAAVPYTLIAKNPGGQPLYNVSFSDVLPAGFEYVAPTTPSSAGEPTVSTDSQGRTVLVWTNITDLQANSSFTLKFKAQLTTPVPPVISITDVNTGYVAGSKAERKVPSFTSEGVPVTGPDFLNATDTAPTEREPYVIEKQSTNSPEGELLRGVHKQRSTYTLTIRNNESVPTNDVTITDYLPAGLEFLGCGDKDNSTVVTQEYPGSGPLGTPAVNPADCLTPEKVETVEDPPGVGTGVFTAVTWKITQLAVDEVREIRYVAGIPLKQNTMAWPGTVPPVTGAQGSNLDNNTGSSTREGVPERSLTNKVVSTGTFTGNPTQAVTVNAEHTVTIEDIRMQKDTVEQDPSFDPGGIVTFRFRIQASEYMNGSNIAVADTLPDGYCPLSATTDYWPGAPDNQCASGAARPTIATDGATAADTDYIAGTQWNPPPASTYTVKFPDVTVSANKTTVVTMPARMLRTYRATSEPTLAGDSFRDTVTLDGKTTAIKDSNNQEIEQLNPVDITDDSEYEQGTPLPTISKQIKTRAAPPDFQNGMKCDPGTPPPYVSKPNPLPEFRNGDVICFKLRVEFPENISTKAAVVTDFPPVDTKFVTTDDPATGNNKYALTTDNTVTAVATLTEDALQIVLGDGGFVPPGGKVFEATFAVQVQTPGIADKPQITGNLMKMRTENTKGVAQSYRDQADYGLLPPPDVAIDKGVIATDKPSATYPKVNGRLQDNKPIEQGGTATFQIDVTNKQRLTGGNYSVRGVQVWDVLPTQLTCASVDLATLKYIPTSGGSAQNLPGGIATCADVEPGKSILKWVFPSPDLLNVYSIDTGQTLSLIYTMKVPSEAAAGTVYDNKSGVRQYEAFTDIPEQTATYIPEKNIDPTQDTKANAPEATDPSKIFIPGVVVAKSGTTSLDETNNNTPTEATIGELVYYTYSVTIKKGTTVYRGVLSDDLPTGFEFVVVEKATLDGGPLPPGFNIGLPNYDLTFPAKWSNDTNADQKFEVTVWVKVGQTAAQCKNATCTLPPDTVDKRVESTNTAKFVSYPVEVGGTATTTRKTYKVYVVQPEPSIIKTADPTSVTSTATDITYTVKAKTPVDRPPLHDVEVIDCIPNTLTVKAGSISDSGTTLNVPSCGTDVAIKWTFDPLAPGVEKVLTYKANIKPGAPADVKFKNTVGLSGTSMPGVVTGERTYRTGGNAEVFITGASIDKSVTPSIATIGQTVTYKVGVKLPDAAYSNLVVLDTLPPWIDATNLNTVSVTCSTTAADYTNPQACTSPPTFGRTFLPATTTVGATGQTVGWAFDPLPDQDKHRIITIEYTARVSNKPANVAGEQRKNTAEARYGYTNKPTSVTEAQQGTSTSIGKADSTFSIAEPNLKIQKKVNDLDEITALPDDTFTYKVTVSNPQRANSVPTSTAHDVTILDCVPDGIVVTGAVTDDRCTTSLKNAVVNTVTVDVGQSRDFSYTARLRGDTSTAQTNVASALTWYSLTPDPNNTDIRAYGPITADAKVTPLLPDVRIDKKASEALAYIGQPYTWTIEVSNPSNASPAPTAYDVSVKDTLPPNWTYKAGSTTITLPDATTATTDPVVDPTDSRKLTWSKIANLPANKTITIVFQGIPGSDVVTSPGVGIGVPHINSASTTWFPGDPQKGWTESTPKTDSAQTEIASADLQLLKSHVTTYSPPLQAEKDEVIPGTSFKWQMDVKNLGEDTSQGPFVVTDTLPPGNTYASWSGSGWSGCVQDPVNSQKITCTHPNLPAGLGKNESLEPLFIIVTVDLDAPATMKNTATVTGKTYDPNLTNNTDDDTVTSRPQADVAIEKSSSGSYVVGNQVKYTLAVTNLGPSTAAAPVTVTDTLPSGLSIASIDAGPWTCTPATGETTSITCVLNQPIAPNTQAPLINLTMDVLESPGPKAENCAVAGSPTEDPVTENNKSCVTDSVVSEVQLDIVKKLTGPNPVAAGESTEFTITVTNQGPATAKNVQVFDILGPGLTATSAVGKGWTCDLGTGTIVTCTRPNLAVKDSPSDIVVTVLTSPSLPAGSTFKNTATVSTTSPPVGGSGGPRPPAIDGGTIVTKSDLAITKTHRKAPWTIGKTGNWYMSVTNNGPSDNPGPITVTDNLPRGTEYVSATGEGWTCDGSARFFTCTSASGLPVGVTAPEITVLVNVVEGAAPSVLNTATVTSPTPDPKPENNTDTDEVPVKRAKQTVPPLPPGVVKGGTTDQGQKIRTKIRCLPLKASAAGEVSYCKVKRTKNGIYKINVIGDRPMRVIVTQFARGTKNYEPWKRVKRFIVRP